MRPDLLVGALVAAVSAAHYAYYLWPAQSSDRLWAKYVGDGAGFGLLCVLLALCARRLSPRAAPLIVAVAAWGAFDGLQQLACGLLRWGKTPNGVDLCIEQFGPWPYIALAAALLVWFASRTTP